MPDINNILTNLNQYYTEITDLIPLSFNFIDDFELAIDEFDITVNSTPMGFTLLRLSDGKLIWGGISGGEGIGGYNVRKFNTDYSLDESFEPVLFDQPNEDGSVRDVAEQTTGKLIVVGEFETINSGTTVNRIVRLNTDGSYDSTFNNGGSNFDGDAFVVKVLNNNSILVAGAFNNYNSSSCEKIIKLNADGSVDESFTPPSFNSDIEALAIAANGDIYVGGSFTTPENYLVRLNSDGTVDNAFDVGAGFNDLVRTIAIDSDGKILVGGDFTQYKGDAIQQICRVATDGTRDTTFELDGPFNTDGDSESVQSIAIQSNGKILVGGYFWTLDGNNQRKLVRLNSNGTKDTSFEIEVGFNTDYNDWDTSGIQDMIINADNSILVTGNIQAYQNKPINAFARLSPTGTLFSTRILKYKKTFGINDGSNDMFDGGNSINTNLTQIYDNIKEGSENFELSIPNTHTAAGDNEAFSNPLNNYFNDYVPLMDGSVKLANSYFGAGSKYFTNYYPGLFVMVATDIDIEEFSITGELGSDSDTDLESSEVELNGTTYSCFMKTNIEVEGDDPTVNHIILVPGTLAGLTHLTNVDEDDYDDDCVQGLADRDHVYYLLFATGNENDAVMVSFETCQQVAEKFLEVISRGIETPNIKGCNKTCTNNELIGFGCNKSITACTCAKMRYFYPGCKNINSPACFGRQGAFVPAITVCNQKLF
jgi:uncharacterized delta-60 repeat protein